MSFRSGAWSRAAAIAEVRALTDVALLAFSRGKDSIATWLTLRDAGFRVVAFHMEIVPGLSFVEESLKYYEDLFGQHIYRVLHPNLYHWIATGVAQRITTIFHGGYPRPPWGLDDSTVAAHVRYP